MKLILPPEEKITTFLLQLHCMMQVTPTSEEIKISQAEFSLLQKLAYLELFSLFHSSGFSGC